MDVVPIDVVAVEEGWVDVVVPAVVAVVEGRALLVVVTVVAAVPDVNVELAGPDVEVVVTVVALVTADDSLADDVIDDEPPRPIVEREAFDVVA